METTRQLRNSADQGQGNRRAACTRMGMSLLEERSPVESTMRSTQKLVVEPVALILHAFRLCMQPPTYGPCRAHCRPALFLWNLVSTNKINFEFVKS